MIPQDPTTEKPVDLDESGLFGILTAPKNPLRTGLILINPGLIHRVGPHRLYVELSRRLAKSGYASIRLDQSGKGDSDVREHAVAEGSILADITAAAKQLHAACGCTEFLLGGLCSGADDTLQAAPRVEGLTGIIMIDGYAPRSFKYLAHRYWRSVRRRMVSRNISRRSRNAADSLDLRNWETPRQMSERIRSLLEAGVHIFALYTSGASDYYSYSRQLTSSIEAPVSGRLITEYFFPEATHLFPVTAHRERLIGLIDKWARENFT